VGAWERHERQRLLPVAAIGGLTSGGGTDGDQDQGQQADQQPEGCL
jgi:hypothetical protein